MKEFLNIFEPLGRVYGWHSVFADFAEITSCAVHQMPYHIQLVKKDIDFERVEEQYMAVVNKYKKEELDIICKLYAVTVQELNIKPYDFLGAVYQRLNINNKQNGEFFTPPHISELMARVALNDIGGLIDKKGLISICEPSCGAGVMLIEAVNVIQELNYDPRKVMCFQATDINRICFNMCYIQMSQLGIAGEVIHGNTITGEIWESRITPQERVYYTYRKYCFDNQSKEDVKQPEDIKPVKTQFAFDF
jgi:type I restriction-modification system DNA methylase subunit